MPRHRPSAADELLTMDLDTGFTGVNDRLEPSLLRSGHAFYALNQELAQPGLCAAGVNVRFGAGQAETRPGWLTPAHFNPGFTAIRGAGVFSDPNGREWLLVADATCVWMLADGEMPQRLSLPGGTTLQESCRLVQAFDHVLMFRGAAPTLVWKSDRTKPFATVRRSPARDDAPSFLHPIPAAAWGVVVADRVFLPVSRDELAWSDLEDYTRFDLALNTVRVSAGNDDELVYAVPFRGDRLIVFKTQSFYALTGLQGADILETVSLETLSIEIGLHAADTVCAVGGDLFWLATGHVYRMTETVQDSLQASPVPVSLDIENTMRRINWAAARNAQAVVIDQYYHLAVPLDGSTVNNAVLVYDTTTRQWQGVDVLDLPAAARAELPPVNNPTVVAGGPGALVFSVGSDGPAMVDVACQRLLKTDLFGRRTAFLIDAARVVALGHGHGDMLFGLPVPTYTRIDTRGYVFGQLGIKQVREILLALETWDADLTVTLIVDGVAEEKRMISRKRRNKLRYTRFGLAPWDRTNVHDDFGAPHREDYSVHAGDGSQPRSGLATFLPQHWQISFPVRANARWAAVRVESFSGHVRLKAVQAEARPERQFHKHIA